MVLFICLTLFIWINTILNAYMDKRRSETTYPEWHIEYPKWEFCLVFHLPYFNKPLSFQLTIPHFIWSKLRNRWHIVKQAHFLGSNFMLTLFAVKTLPFFVAVACFIVIILIGQFLWGLVSRPPWWD